MCRPNILGGGRNSVGVCIFIGSSGCIKSLVELYYAISLTTVKLNYKIMIDNKNSNIYEKAITTDRSAELLARKHGYDSIAQLAEELPEGARVLDVGAGASPFGKEVAKLRPDISWVNFDFSYQDPDILKEAEQGAPDNVECIFGDATRLDEVFGAESFNIVFSYWLMPHLSLDNVEPAERVAEAMVMVTKPGGQISVGPIVGKNHFLSIKSGNSLRIYKDEDKSTESYVREIVDATKLSGLSRTLQKNANEVATPFFGTTRYGKREGKVPKIFDPKTGEYVSVISGQGIYTLGRLAVVLAKHATRRQRA